MKLEELGEIGVIERIIKKFQVESQIIAVGAGDDDFAVIDLEKAKDRYLIVTPDTLQQSTHFPPGITPFQIG